MDFITSSTAAKQKVERDCCESSVVAPMTLQGYGIEQNRIGGASFSLEELTLKIVPIHLNWLAR